MTDQPRLTKEQRDWVSGGCDHVNMQGADVHHECCWKMLAKYERALANAEERIAELEESNRRMEEDLNAVCEYCKDRCACPDD